MYNIRQAKGRNSENQGQVGMVGWRWKKWGGGGRKAFTKSKVSHLKRSRYDQKKLIRKFRVRLKGHSSIRTLNPLPNRPPIKEKLTAKNEKTPPREKFMFVPGPLWPLVFVTVSYRLTASLKDHQRQPSQAVDARFLTRETPREQLRIKAVNFIRQGLNCNCIYMYIWGKKMCRREN